MCMYIIAGMHVYVHYSRHACVCTLKLFYILIPFENICKVFFFPCTEFSVHFIAYCSCPCYSQFMLIQRCSFCIFSICLNVASIDKEGVQANGKFLKELC